MMVQGNGCWEVFTLKVEVVNFAKNNRVKHLLERSGTQDLVLFSWNQLNIPFITWSRLEPHSLIVKGGPFLQLKVFQIKYLHTYMYVCLGKSQTCIYIKKRKSPTTLPCHTHTYKAYFYIICFKLCAMTFKNQIWQQSKQLHWFNKIILFLSENILTVLILAFP